MCVQRTVRKSLGKGVGERETKESHARVSPVDISPLYGPSLRPPPGALHTPTRKVVQYSNELPASRFNLSQPPLHNFTSLHNEPKPPFQLSFLSFLPVELQKLQLQV